MPNIQHPTSNIQHPNKAFTLIELLVAMTIFITVISAVVVIFSRALEVQRRTFALQSVQDNARYALEAIAREIRMADVVTGEGGYEELDIINYKGEDVRFKWFLGEAQKQLKVKRNGSPYSLLTSEDVEITNLQFYIRKCTTEEPIIDIQPRVTISMAIRSANPSYQDTAKMHLETTVSTRIYK